MQSRRMQIIEDTSKWYLFIVDAGHRLIQESNNNTGKTVEFEVSGDKIEVFI